MAGPLAGYRVIEIAEGVAGPYAAMSLGDAGADVIKIEPPAGDRSRGWSPPLGESSAAWTALNRNKRGIVLDFGNERDLATARRLLQQADIAVVDKFGLPPQLAWAALDAEQLVYCALSGWGPRGPWAERPASELAAQLASEATLSLGRLGDPPVRLGTDAGSMYAANYAIQGICAALYARDAAGRGGQRLEVSLFGSLLAMRSTLWVALSKPDEWWGFHLDSYIKPPDHGYQCRDLPIFFSLAAMGDENAERLIDDLQMGWVREDARYELLKRDVAGGAGRHAHELKQLWEQGFAQWSATEVIQKVERRGGWAFPMHDYQRLTQDPQITAAGAVVNVEGIAQVAPPWDFAQTPTQPPRPAPNLGQHTTEVLAELSSGDPAIIENKGGNDRRPARREGDG